jgi:UDP-glucose 4-epimerase
VADCVIVTGATGFVGRHVVARLMRDGIPVLGVSAGGGPGVEALDLTDADSVAVRMRNVRCRGVLHLAAAVPDSAAGADDPSIQSAIAAIDRTVVELCRAAQWPLVYASSAAVYDFRLDGPLRESSPTPARSAYASAKLAGEERALELVGPACVLRIAAPYGPGWRRETVVTTFVRRAIGSSPLEYDGTGSRAQDFVYVEDVSDAVVRAFITEAAGVFNVGSGRPISMRELADTVVESVGSSSEVRASGRTDPQEGVTVDLDVSRAESTFGWRARTPLGDGLREIAASMAARA